MKVIPHAPDQFLPSQKILHTQTIIRFEQIHIQMVLLVRDDQKVNFEMTKRSILHFLDQKVNLL